MVFFNHIQPCTNPSWWFQPIWKILYSQIGSFPQVGVKIKNVWNHHLAPDCSFQPYPTMHQSFFGLLNWISGLFIWVTHPPPRTPVAPCWHCIFGSNSPTKILHLPMAFWVGRSNLYVDFIDFFAGFTCRLYKSLLDGYMILFYMYMGMIHKHRVDGMGKSW